MKILRVFPHRNKATPDDEFVRIGLPTLFDTEIEIDAVRIDVTFKWDLPLADKMQTMWGKYYSTEIGGVALGDPGGEFIPGMYLKSGYVITSRGCPNRCWFCDAWKREGKVRELQITEGKNLLDNNLLACSAKHIYAVFDMLKKQSGVVLTGGLEAARLRDWHVNELVQIKPKQMFFAYDTESDYEPLVVAGKKLIDAGFSMKAHGLRCFVLIGFDGDTVSKAEGRMTKTIKAGFVPMAMYYRNNEWRVPPGEWHDFIYVYSSPIAMAKKIRELHPELWNRREAYTPED